VEGVFSDEHLYSNVRRLNRQSVVNESFIH
jgi:hypothetical protein